MGEFGPVSSRGSACLRFAKACHTPFDAFGNNLKDALGAGASYAWRWQEGSVTDRHSGLVHMPGAPS